MKWIKVKDELPENSAQDLFYYFDAVGVFEGHFYGLEPDGYVFGGKSGWLTGDATHWMPRKEGDELPGVPE